MAVQKQPVVLEALENPTDDSKKSVIIFLHGLGDDGRGTGYGLAQQFQIHKKLPYAKWVLPTASVDPTVGQRCWYKPHDLPSPLKPKVPGHEADTAEVDKEEDEDGIFRTVEYIDGLIAAEVEGGVDPGNIAIGGFSQGSAVAMVWGLKGHWRDKVAGVFGLSGYFPKIMVVKPDEVGKEIKHAARWFFGHGMTDMAISINLFADGQKRLQQFVDRDSIEGHVYEALSHEVGGGEVRDLWLWLNTVLSSNKDGVL